MAKKKSVFTRFIGPVAVSAAFTLGYECINPLRHQPYILPESHSEVPDGAPAPQLSDLSYSTATTNAAAPLLDFWWEDGSRR